MRPWAKTNARPPLNSAHCIERWRDITKAVSRTHDAIVTSILCEYGAAVSFARAR